MRYAAADSSTASWDAKTINITRRMRDRRRRAMIRRDLVGRGIRNPRVLAAMARIPREEFVPPIHRRRAYRDHPLPIGHGQTISQPFIVALMTECLALSRSSRILEIGTGCGYQTAVLATIAKHVWTIERIPALSAAAAERVTRLGITNVTWIVGDGAAGWPDAAPYDGILITAAVPAPPEPLIRQLAPSGIMVAPVGQRTDQELIVYTRAADGLAPHLVGGCRFVPLVSPLAFDE